MPAPMPALVRIAALFAFVVASAGLALAADNPLIGTWLHTDPGVPGMLPASSVYMTFTPDGRYQVRTDFAGGAAGQASGSNVVRGGYQLTGPNSIAYWETENYMCSGGACNPSPPLNPDFGQRKEGSFQMLGPTQMQAVGATWNRVQ
ncbi:MAG: hypothetical protein J0H63_03655 [Rhizobiales bacterium]|nr:hypothetical protein [Hyphomicrobiales bacterium]